MHNLAIALPECLGASFSTQLWADSFAKTSSLLDAPNVHWVVAAIYRLRQLLGWGPWEFRAVLVSRRTDLRADSLVVAALVRAYGPWVVLGPFRSRRRLLGDLCNSSIS
jgi:hypothetical protein